MVKEAGAHEPTDPVGRHAAYATGRFSGERPTKANRVAQSLATTAVHPTTSADGNAHGTRGLSRGPCAFRCVWPAVPWGEARHRCERVKLLMTLGVRSTRRV